jgi:hypothetical protein
LWWLSEDDKSMIGSKCLIVSTTYLVRRGRLGGSSRTPEVVSLHISLDANHGGEDSERDGSGGGLHLDDRN